MASAETRAMPTIDQSVRDFGVAETLHFLSSVCWSEAENSAEHRSFWEHLARQVGGFSARVRAYEHR